MAERAVDGSRSKRPPGAGLAARHVTLTFDGVAALEDVSIELAPGESVALVGPSGAGKTSLLRVLCGWYAPTRGRAEIDGRPIDALPQAELRAARSTIGFVHQDLSLIPNLRVVQNVIAGRLGRMSWLGALRSIWWPDRDSLRRVHSLLERVGIEEKLFQRTDRLSGGQQQRVAIARALYQEPRALLADEPVSSVDPARARDTVELLTTLAAEGKQTLVVSLHNAELAREFFPRLVGMRAGRIEFDRASPAITARDLDELYRLDPGPAP